MNDRSLDEVLDAWLDDGPVVVPEQVVDAALAEIPTTKQLGARRAPLEGALMRLHPYAIAAGTVSLAAAAIVIYLALAGGLGNVGGPDSDPTVAPTPSAPAEAFASDDFPVSIRASLPSGWLAAVNDPKMVGFSHVDTDSWVVLMPADDAGFVESTGFRPWPDDMSAYLTEREEFEPLESRSDLVGGHEASVVDARGDYAGPDDTLPLTVLDGGPITTRMYARTELWSFWTVDVTGNEDVVIVVAMLESEAATVSRGVEQIIDTIEIGGD